jgi:hypothetical protein
MVNVPPGRWYIVGVRTAGYYPQIVPVAVNVHTDGYASAWVSLTAGPQQPLRGKW